MILKLDNFTELCLPTMKKSYFFLLSLKYQFDTWSDAVSAGNYFELWLTITKRKCMNLKSSLISLKNLKYQPA